MLQALLRETLQSSTAHGISRALSAKGWTVRVFWLIAFLVFFCVFWYSVVNFTKKLSSGEIATNLQAASVPFDFPDLYFCFDSPLSGSYYLRANQSVADEVQATLAAFNAKVYSHCGASLTENSSFACISVHGDYDLFFGVNSLRYRLLAESLSRRAEQLFLRSTMLTGNSFVIVTQQKQPEDFYHAAYGRCFRLRFNASEQAALRQSGSSSGIDIQMLMDSYDYQQHAWWNGTLLPNIALVPAPLWMLSPIRVDTFSMPVLRLFMTQAGQFPGQEAKNLLLRPGFMHTVSIEQRDEEYDEAEFGGRSCAAKRGDVQFVNPLDGSAQGFVYSYDYCFYTVVSEALKDMMNASDGSQPQPWPKVPLASIFNLTESDAIFGPIKSSVNLQSALAAACGNARPCSRRHYMAEVASLPWPLAGNVDTVLQLVNARLLSGADAPALQFMQSQVKLMTLKQKADFLQSRVLRLRIRAASKLGDKLSYSYAYTFNNFIADVGGIMGMYLGMSLLTVCELFELMYSVAMLRSSGPVRGAKVKPRDSDTRTTVATADTTAPVAGDTAADLPPPAD